MPAATFPCKLRQLGLAALSIALISACTVLPVLPSSFDQTATAPKLDGFGAVTLAPARIKPEAAPMFAQGVAQAYAFNEKEAVRAFKAALATDTDCAMCAWGVAWQLGPNINFFKRGDLTEAIRYVDYAIQHSAGASARDRDLIAALALRYGRSSVNAQGAPLPDAICRSGSNDPADPLDIAYADRMRQLADRYPDDPDVLTIYAEAEMVATRDEHWDRKTGKPAGLIGELADRIEKALVRHPDHVGLNHYMIHSVSSEQVAGRAVAASDRLGKLAPKSPHLLHMPSHIYALVGRYADAARVNQLAVKADWEQMDTLKAQKFEKTKVWLGHNFNFLWYASLMAGQGDQALAAAREAADAIDGDHSYGEYIRSLPMLTLLHLQRWDALLAEPMPRGARGLAGSLGEMARGIALVHKGQLAEAKAALNRLDPEAQKILKEFSANDKFTKTLRGLVNSTGLELRAAIAQAEHHGSEGLRLQQKAVEESAEANLSEPPMLAGGPALRLAAMQQEQAQAQAQAQVQVQVQVQVPADAGTR